MATTSLEQYTIADFLEFRAAKRLVLNPEFQRRDIWKPAAKVYLIDSILRGLPLPKMFFRTEIDARTQSSVREVVDGQQRLRAIFSFADNELRLTARAKEFVGLRYRDLDETLQDAFLAYTIAAEQLINADDSLVLEIFARMNTYSVSLNPAELRHAEFQSDFKWLVHEAAQRWNVLWEWFRIVSTSQRTRMADDALMAQMFLTVTQGVTSGEARQLKKAYRHYDMAYPDADDTILVIDSTLDAIVSHLEDALVGPIASAPHFLMVFAAVAHALHGIGRHPVAGLPSGTLPARPAVPNTQDEWDAVRDALLSLGALIEQDDAPTDSELARFWNASRTAPVALASREVRFPFYLAAVGD